MGGIQNYVHKLAVALHQRGEDVTVFCDAAAHPDATVFDKQQPFEIVRVPGPKFLRRRIKSWRLKRHLANVENALVICDSWKSLELLALPLDLSVRVVCLAHGMEFSEVPSPRRSSRVKQSLVKANLILANSTFTADRLLKYSPSSQKVKILHPGVDVVEEPSPQDAKRVESWVAGFDPVLTTVGRVEARKGQDKIIEILPRLLADYPRLLYIVAGAGPGLEQLKQRATDVGVLEKVRFCGRVTDSERSAVLNGSDLFVMPSRQVGDSVEGFGIVYLEAAMFGLASLAGRVGGASDAVVEGVTGALCDGDQAEDIYGEIKTLLANRQKLREMGRLARERASTAFLWPVVASNLLELVDEMSRGAESSPDLESQ
ncbi:glycosyltransferase family 4 protein [Spongiibacter sp. IMCC21906]|uniref:glycosyltransferase family 4 protein n=1 Tax=Spongiibacter sp. IMCC21906 TaxID=1620392 RepID=UPI001E3410F7|nr:glycosyltransferase family 4 protein [Spongiibacter sp. IMCC21906]